jgi:hypothetical protein
MVLRSSPMAGATQEVAEPGEEGLAADDGKVGGAGEDRRDRDTRLSRASDLGYVACSRRLSSPVRIDSSTAGFRGKEGLGNSLLLASSMCGLQDYIALSPLI